MADGFHLGRKLSPLVERVTASYQSDRRTHYIDNEYLPSRREIVEIIELLLELVYPGYHGRQGLTWDNVAYHVGELLPRIADKLERQVRSALCHQSEVEGTGCSDGGRRRSGEMTLAFLDRIPSVRERLAADAQAAYDGDPAAVGTDEILLAYPGFLAVSVHRLAHELHAMGVPLIPRIMTEWAHSVTGVDIHPGAAIGRSFFIDHASGVVIGETTVIGDSVKIYQGVTLGAMSFPKDERGKVIRGYKRHPTIEDEVVIYANATILGGETVVGARSTIGGGVFLTRSVPADCRVTLSDPQLKVSSRRPRT